MVESESSLQSLSSMCYGGIWKLPSIPVEGTKLAWFNEI